MTRSSSRFLAAMAVVGAAIAASLVGGVGVGHASTSFDVQLKALIAAGSTDPVPEVSYGGKIGYELKVQNTDTSNTTHVQVVVKVPSATFFDSTDASCAAAKGDSSTMICIPTGGTMNAGATYVVDFRFTAPTSGSSVTATPSVSIAAKTQGSPGNNGTTVSTGTPVSVVLNADGSTNDTYLRHDENAEVLTPQNFKATLPGSLLGDPFGLELGIHSETQTGAPICPTCLAVDTDLTIPAASLVGIAHNPFYFSDGTTTTFNPYGWTMSATAATSFKLHGVFHIDFNGNGGDLPIPACAVLPGGGPTADFPVCYDTLTSKNKAGVQNLAATGRGLENGKVGFG
jgi:hypothetical protein